MTVCLEADEAPEQATNGDASADAREYLKINCGRVWKLSTSICSNIMGVVAMVRCALADEKQKDIPKTEPMFFAPHVPSTPFEFLRIPARYSYFLLTELRHISGYPMPAYL